ncbi:MAG: hypothetical protein FWE45_02505 [Firmicutes bacterium]|nr:hypothetical protein [Bacillota bacterium]
MEEKQNGYTNDLLKRIVRGFYIGLAVGVIGGYGMQAMSDEQDFEMPTRPMLAGSLLGTFAGCASIKLSLRRRRSKLEDSLVEDLSLRYCEFSDKIMLEFPYGNPDPEISEANYEKVETASKQFKLKSQHAFDSAIGVFDQNINDGDDNGYKNAESLAMRNFEFKMNTIILEK